MSLQQPLRKIAVDPGFGGFKVAEARDGQVYVDTIPSVVGIGKTDLGQLSTGLDRPRKLAKPLTVSFGGAVTYLVGPNIHYYARPVERLDFQRLSEGPELRALLYTALWQIVNGGSQQLALMMGLPVEVVQDEVQVEETLRTLRAWLVGDHAFTVNGQNACLTITQVKAMAQPVGTYFAWCLDPNGQPLQPPAVFKQPIGICDLGFNTIDLFALEGGQILGRFTGGDTLGMHRAAATIARHVKEEYGVSLSLHQADDLVKTALKRRKPLLYHAGGETDLSEVVGQALSDTFAACNQFIREHWEQGRQFRHLIITGGGAQALREPLIKHYPHAIILNDPVTANAQGLAKFAARTRVFG